MIAARDDDDDDYYLVLKLVTTEEQQVLWFVYLNKVMVATIVEGNLKTPCSITTTPRCRRGRYSIPWFAPLLLIRSLKC